MEACAIADAGGNGDYGAGDQATNDAGEGTLHTGADDCHASLRQPLVLLQEPVNARYAHIADGLDFIAHDLGRQLRLLEDGNIASTGTDGRDLAFAMYSPITPDAYDARRREKLC